MAEIRSVEDYLVDMINQKYAKRIMQKMNTEYEKLTLERGSEPGIKEYEWMVNKALSIHRQMNLSPELASSMKENENEKKAED